MAGKNKVEQKVSLNIGAYRVSLGKLRQEQRSTTEDTKKSVREQAKEYEASTERIKKSNLSLSRSLKDVAKDFKKNLYEGTVITAGVSSAAVLKKSYGDAAKSVLDLGQNLSRLTSRFNLSADKAKSLRKELQTLGTLTGVNGGLITQGAEELMAADPKRRAVGIGSVAKFSAMSDVAPKEVARTVIDFLKGSGQELSDKNVEDFLTSVTSLSRGGDLSLEEALKAASVDSASKAKLNLSNRENSALIAAASGVGQDRGSSIAGLNAVLKKSVGGFGESAALAGILGIKGGSFMKDGKFDVSKLQEASQNLNKQGLNKADFTKLMESTGLSSEESEGLYSILKDFDKFNSSFQSVVKDSKTLEASFADATDNLKDAFGRFTERIGKASTDILSPLGEIGKDLLNGEFGKAISNSPGRVGESAEAVWDNKGLVALGLGATAMTGALAKKIGGIFGMGSAKDMAKGLAIQEATGGKVQPVMIVNVQDLADAMGSKGIIGDGLSTGGKVAGGGAMAAIWAKMVGSKAAGLAVNAGIAAAPYAAVAGAGALGYGAGHLINKYGPTFNGKTDEGYEGGLVERLFFKLDALFGGENAANIQKANKLQLEVIDNGERFTAKPKAGDLQRNNVGG